MKTISPIRVGLPSETKGNITAKFVGDILGSAADLNQPELERLCKSALSASHCSSILSKHEAVRTNMKSREKKMMDFLTSGVSTMSAVQMKNHSLRFGLDEGHAGLLQRQSWAIVGAKNSFFGGGSVSDSRDYEDVISEEMLRAPISEICIIQRGEPVPDGYYRLSKTPSDKRANLNSGSGGNQIYLCIKKDLTWDAVPITSLVVIFPDKEEFVPPGFFVVRRGKNACNLNTGTSAERVFLCYKKDRSGNPITDMQVILPTKNEEAPKSFSVVEKSPSNYPANLNAGTGGGKIYLCYRQNLVQLSCLANDEIISAKDIRDSSSASSPMQVKNARVISGGNTPSNTTSNTTSGVQAAAYTAAGGRGGVASTGTTATAGAVKIKPMNRNQSEPFLQSLATVDTAPHTDVNMNSKHHTMNVRTIDSPVHAHTQRKSIGASFSEEENRGGGGVRGATGSAVTQKGTSSDSHAIMSALSEGEGAGAGGDFSDDENNAGETTPRRQSVDVGEIAIEEVDAVEANADIETTAAEDLAAMSASEETYIVPDRRSMAVVDVDGIIAPMVSRKTLHALLAALYVRHGNVAASALTSLTAMLKETDFFESDLRAISLSGTITMLDLTIEAICDRLDAYHEHEHEGILTFFRIVIKHSSGKISTTSLQKMFRGLAFLLSTYSSKTSWVVLGQPHPCADTGADTLAFKVFKELTWATVAQVETAEVAHFLPDFQMDEYCYDGCSEAYMIARNFVVEFVEDVIDSVEVSRLSEAAHMTIAKPSSTCTSPLFWMQIGALSRKLFIEAPLRSAFLDLCALCKLAYHPIRVTDGGPTPRDLGVKLLALEALLEFCVSAGERMRVSKVMGYQIRRLVVPCLLINIPYAMVDHRVFSKCLRIVTALWKTWRLHTRIEFANICEQLVIRILQASTFKVRPIFQKIVLEEVVTWFDQPHLLVEMFVNFDMDRKFVSHWEVFSHLVRSVCAIARRISLITGAWDWRPSGSASSSEGGGGSSSSKVSNVTIREVNMQALEEVSRIAKTLMDATGHAHLMLQDARFRKRSLNVGAGWEEDESQNDSPRQELDLDSLTAPYPANNSSSSNTTDRPHATTMASVRDLAASTVPVTYTEPVQGSHSDDSSERRGQKSGRGVSGGQRMSGTKAVQGVKFRRAEHQEAEELLQQATKLFAVSKSLKKAVQFLIKKGFMADSPQEIATFIRVYKNSFDPSSIGDFLGEGGLPNTPEEEYWTKIRFRYVRAVSFVEMDVDHALRLFLTGCGFRLPGEAQKVDRMVEVFVKAYWQDNAGTQYCPFRHSDTVHLLVFATIMLNTDLHKATDAKGKKRKKMTKDEFSNQLKDADQGQSVDKEYLDRIYESIKAQPIELAVEASEGGKADSNDANTQGESVSVTEERAFVKEISRAVRDSEDLLHSLSPFTFNFQITGVDTNISLDLVSFMYETVWFHFHAITEALLSSTNSDIYVTFAALDILCYSLTSSIFLDLKTERIAFAAQLHKFQKMCLAADPSMMAKIHGDGWIDLVESATTDTAMEAISEVHQFVVRLKDGIQESANYEVTRSVAARIEKKAKVLEQNTFFVREGDLSKRSRAGRMVSYRFFLFSDHLIYSHLTMSGEYKVHEQLSLSTMNVSDVDDPSGCSLFISHPTKSFLVVAESKEAKQQWLRDIYQTIASCRKREQQLNSMMSRKMSIIDRIEVQQKGHETRVNNLMSVAGPDRVKPPSYSNLIKTVDTDASNGGSGSGSGNSNGSAKVSGGNASTMSPLLNPSSPSSSSAVAALEGSSYPPSAPSSSSSSSSSHNGDHSGDGKDGIASAKSQAYHMLNTPSPPSSSPPVPLSAAERAAVKEAAIKTFKTRITELPEKKLQALFTAGANFWKGMQDSRGGGGVADESKQRLAALYRQAKGGGTGAGAGTGTGSGGSSGAGSSSSSGRESTDGNSGSGASASASNAGTVGELLLPETGVSSSQSQSQSPGRVTPEERRQELGCDLSADEAMRSFLELLFSIAPYWKYEQFL